MNGSDPKARIEQSRRDLNENVNNIRVQKVENGYIVKLLAGPDKISRFMIFKTWREASEFVEDHFARAVAQGQQ